MKESVLTNDLAKRVDVSNAAETFMFRLQVGGKHEESISLFLHRVLIWEDRATSERGGIQGSFFVKKIRRRNVIFETKRYGTLYGSSTLWQLTKSFCCICNDEVRVH